ncbi:Proteinase inhibitor I2, Kunitz metazoa domain-containing protein [Strongyloides ratti]|uniref:Proteinase inhibitor I2, Kunitz metazoa domain-containing protein n=1 Tax=Strongyloides ratti TaxID=34506 RepID=A0A090L760_STRRB|nr:Proteinase inhibitor I2, Kunitz metazoa domain-containing protein [Strongyloides ratti]CEF63334.1 Proteinase inhibitor I2, Kunitz metazoa domain-containing protein [Strongyloides ratti]
MFFIFNISKKNKIMNHLFKYIILQIFLDSTRYPSLCYLPPDSALCMPTDMDGNFIDEISDDLPIRFYFDIVTEQCYPFGAQTCGGNENNFGSEEECQAICKVTSKENMDKYEKNVGTPSKIN